MREIIFRGKRLDNGEWVEGFYNHIPNGRFGTDEHMIQTIKENGKIGMLYDVDPSTVGQNTGLKDKHGKRIFEGDIIKSDNGRYSAISVVKFGEYYPKMFCAMLAICCPGTQHLNANGFYLASTKHEDMILFKSRYFEIIGNVHDNLELLKEEDET